MSATLDHRGISGAAILTLNLQEHLDPPQTPTLSNRPHRGLRRPQSPSVRLLERVTPPRLQGLYHHLLLQRLWPSPGCTTSCSSLQEDNISNINNINNNCYNNNNSSSSRTHFPETLAAKSRRSQ